MKVRNYFFAGFCRRRGVAREGNEDLRGYAGRRSQECRGAGLAWRRSILRSPARRFKSKTSRRAASCGRAGLKEMDDAVALAPDQLGVVIPRGAVLLTASQVCSQSGNGAPADRKRRGDFEKTYQLQAPYLDKMGTHPRGELMIGLADGYNRLGNQEKAQEWFERIQKEHAGHALREVGQHRGSKRNRWLRRKPAVWAATRASKMSKMKSTGRSMIRWKHVFGVVLHRHRGRPHPAGDAGGHAARRHVAAVRRSTSAFPWFMRTASAAWHLQSFRAFGWRRATYRALAAMVRAGGGQFCGEYLGQLDRGLIFVMLGWSPLRVYWEQFSAASRSRPFSPL